MEAGPRPSSRQIPPRTDALVAAAARLIGGQKRVTHGQLFRIRVTASDGKPASVTIQIDDHPGEARPYVLGDIAKRLRINKDDVEVVLGTWTREQLIAHLEQFTSDELKPPALR